MRTTSTNPAPGSSSPASRTSRGCSPSLDALPWEHTPVAARELDRGHGRITTRTIQVLPAPADPPFPHVQQVWLIERYVTDLDGTPRSAVAALGVTNLPAARATPAHLADLVGRHWGIESLHWLRDTVYREDNSTVRTRSGPRAMVSLRNLAVQSDPAHRQTRHIRDDPSGRQET